MRNKTKQNFYLYYLNKDSNQKILLSVKNCKAPERTSQYKVLKSWLNMDLVQSIGWCNQGYFQNFNN